MKYQNPLKRKQQNTNTTSEEPLLGHVLTTREKYQMKYGNVNILEKDSEKTPFPWAELKISPPVLCTLTDACCHCLIPHNCITYSTSTNLEECFYNKNF